MVKLTDENGRPVWVQLDCIEFISPTNIDGKALFVVGLISGASLTVKSVVGITIENNP